MKYFRLSSRLVDEGKCFFRTFSGQFWSTFIKHSNLIVLLRLSIQQLFTESNIGLASYYLIERTNNRATIHIEIASRTWKVNTFSTLPLVQAAYLFNPHLIILVLVVSGDDRLLPYFHHSTNPVSNDNQRRRRRNDVNEMNFSGARISFTRYLINAIWTPVRTVVAR